MHSMIEPTNGHEAIAARAYASWLHRWNGSELQDWLHAEREVRSRLEQPKPEQNGQSGQEAALGGQLAESQLRVAGLLAEGIQTRLKVSAEHEVSRTLAESTEFSAAASPVLRAICESLGWNVGVMWLVDQETAALRCAGFWHTQGLEIAEFEQVCRRASFPAGSGFPGRVWASGSVVWNPDLGANSSLLGSSIPAHEALHGVVGFPIWNGAHVVGVLEFFGPQIVEPAAEAVEMLQCLGRQVGQFVERLSARRGACLQQEEGRIARGIQQRLLPRNMPRIDGVTMSAMSASAREVGGDCFDFIPLSLCGGNELGIVVADASGHGIGASLMVTETRAYLRALALACVDFNSLLEVTNRRLIENGEISLFVTVLMVQIDLCNRSLRYSGAGHCPGYVLNGSGQIKAVLASGGIPLGIECTSRYPTSGPIPLNSGDLLFLYTDGIVEAGCQHGNLFGSTRALDVLRKHQFRKPGEILGELFDAVSGFSPGPLHDDLTAVIVKVENSSGIAPSDVAHETVLGFCSTL